VVLFAHFHVHFHPTNVIGPLGTDDNPNPTYVESMGALDEKEFEGLEMTTKGPLTPRRIVPVAKYSEKTTQRTAGSAYVLLEEA
jgi:hypothetical protein